MMRRLAAALLALLIASPVSAAWVERVGAGAPTSGRLRWVRNTTDSETWVMSRASTHTNILWRHTSADAIANYSSGDFGGSGVDEYHSLSVFQGRQITVGGRQENGVNDLAYQTWLRADLIPGTWNVHSVDTAGAVRGSALGFVFDLVTYDGRRSWVLASTSSSTTVAGLSWRGGASLPGTDGDASVGLSATGRGSEGCVASESTTPAIFGVTLEGGGTIMVHRLVAAGNTSVSTLPTGWATGEDIRVGQCFTVGTNFVAPVYNATDGNTTVVIVSSTPAVAFAQSISGEVKGGAAVGGVGYIVGVGGTLYASNGSATFAAVNDAFASGTPLLVSLNPEATRIELWDADGDISERIAAAPSVTTDPASSVTATGATLNATVNPNGMETNLSFDYGLTTGYGSQVDSGSAGAGLSGTTGSAPVTGLTCGTTYHFRAVGTNDIGTTNGSDATFETSACPPSVSAAPWLDPVVCASMGPYCPSVYVP